MPGPPALINSLPIAIRIGVARSTCSAVPPASSNRVPVMAFAEVRPTGTSIRLKPLACISAINLSVCSGWMVDISMTSASRDKPSQTPCFTEQHAAYQIAVWQHGNYKFGPLAACAGLAAESHPCLPDAAQLRRSHQRREVDALFQQIASPLANPFVLKPINAIADITLS